MRISLVLGGLLLVSGSVCEGNQPSAPPAHRLKKEVLQEILGIPPTMAAVKAGFLPPGQRRLHYVLIEDAHDLPEAQGKIAAILLYAHHHWGSRQAFVEGAFGPIGPPPFPIFSPERGESTANELLRRGLFSGGELAAALASQGRPDPRGPFEVIGMDDPALYWRQLEIVEKLVPLQGIVLDRLARQSPRLSPGESDRLRRLVELRVAPAEFLRDQAAPSPDVNDPVLLEAIREADAYYRLTDLRSRHFADRTRTRVGEGPCLLVMGGFHTRTVAQMLISRNESYVILTPHLTQTNSNLRYPESLLKSLEILRQLPPQSLYASAVETLRLTLSRKPRPNPAE